MTPWGILNRSQKIQNSESVSSMETGDTKGWHRKWLLLLGLLGWLFLYRYRVMGWLLSKVATFQLSKSHSTKFAPIVIQVERVSLKPLRFFNVQLSCAGSTRWSVLLSKVEVQSHVKEFFESFGLVKICILVIDEVVGDVEEVDEELLREIFMPKKPVARNSTSLKAKANPVCYMRFVDLKVQSTRLRVKTMDMVTQLVVEGLYSGITDVFVQRDMFQLKVQTRVIVVQICPHTEGQKPKEDESDGNDGARVEIPNFRVLMDLNLRNQRFLGCKLTGDEEQTTSFVLCMAFLERALTARNEIIRKAAADIKASGMNHSGEPTASTVTPSNIEIAGFQLCITIVNEVETVGNVPLQLCADICKLNFHKQLHADPTDSGSSETVISESNNCNDVRVHVETLIQNTRVQNLLLNRNLLSVSTIEVRAKQTARNRGILAGTFEKVEIFLSHRSEKIFRSLMAAQDRIEKCQVEAKRLVNPLLTRRLSSERQDKNVRIHWDAEIEITAWMMSFKALAKDGGTDDFTAYGTATSVETPLAPVLGENGSSLIKRVIAVQHVSVDVIPSGLRSHSAVFGEAKMVLSVSLDPAQGTKSVATSVKFEYVSVNGLLPDSKNEPTRFPAIFLHNIEVDREEKVSIEVTKVDMDINMDVAMIKWHYQEHKTFLLELSAIRNIIDQLDLLLSSSSKKTKTSSNDHTIPKIVGTNVYSKDTTLDVIDIPNVASLATFCLVETKINHRATQLSVTTAVNTAKASVQWGKNLSTITVTSASFQNRSSLGRQRYLTKVPIQSDIRCTSLKILLRPHSLMLLLFLRLDQLISGSSDKTDGAKRSSVQGISFICGSFGVELVGERAKEDSATVEFVTLGVKITRCTPREISDTIIRLAQCLGKEGLAGNSFAEVAKQVQVLEGSASASSIVAAVPAKNLVELKDTQLHFSMTDVEWSRFLTWESGSVVPRTTSFDLSVLTQGIHLAMEKKPFDAWFRLVPLLQEAFDTRELHSGENAEAKEESPNFRLRYVGNFDVAFQHAELVCPYGDQEGREQIGSKVTRVLLDEVAFNLRQFLAMGLKCSPLRVMLEDAGFVRDSNTSIHPGDDSLQLLFIPKVSINTIIHWKDRVHYAGQLQYALSLEISVGNTQSCDHPTHVPIADEALVALNWDCVVPWLIYMTTDDDGEYPVDNSGKQSSDDSKRIQCVGIQWDVSISVMQFAWWDTATQEVGMLIVVNEFLTHGVIRVDNLDHDNQRQWKLWEATVYLHLFRGYLLHLENEFAEEETSLEILPFGSEMTSNFSLETVGTSYRNTHSPCDGEDWEVLDDEVTATFAPSNACIFEKIHDQFVPIDYEFGFTSKKSVKQETPAGNLPMLHVPTSVRSSSAAISPPKSPRSAKNWTQNIKNRLSRLKRRSASMDNLFLKDGSCPIQVDSMRLLWTLQTRDSVFYMVSTTVDSLRLLLDAKRNAGKAEVQVDSTERGPTFGQGKRSSFRSPSLVSSSPNIEREPVESPRFLNRRGSTRDTLLDLLQQGKLGMRQDDRESSSNSIDEENESSRGSIGEDPGSFDVPKPMIAMKAYTVDIHDVQINVREENTRSNMLLASKHIHFEIGTDAGENNTIANLTFDNVTAHVAPIDVDISAGVLWYSQSSVGSPCASASALLKQIMEECSLTTSYTHTNSTNATSTELDLSFLQLSTDRHQFYQLMNVIRHVLLAPPSVARRPKRTYTPKTNSNESPQRETSDITVFTGNSASTTTNSVATSTSTKKLYVLLEEELRNREIRTRGTSARSKAAMTVLKSISFKVVGMQWKLRLSPEITGADHEFVGIRIQGFTGCHMYFTNHCTKLTLNLQWLEISNLNPGSSSAAFEDPTAVLKATLLLDKRLESHSKVTAGNQKGMLVVRAESGPVVRVHGQKLRVLEVLEVSMFPEVSNMIVIQLAADFYELIYKFFFENISPTPTSQNSEQVLFGRRSMYAPASPTAANSTASSGQKSSSSPFSKSRPSPTPPPQALRALRKTNSSGGIGADSTMALAGPNSPTSVSSSEEVPDESDSTATDDCELFYVKYVRVGNVRLRINCNGFFVNLSHFDLDLPQYVCQSKLCTTKKLLQKFESHLKWYITKESASSGLSQFKNKLLKWTPSSSTEAKKDKTKKQEEDTAAANAQVLFGPYSGTST
ncbi:hypothetical protein P3T76_009326 [Phytophthora citrophthora]|uniref:Uncharacterized protein n=1 Tax=Phytophthora citrophthora TaxID=4793 RepID=A0AAD9GHB4_9STRA|nr:hypothetical protein P3T76_009326 [Phytophthora citrophthora]